MKKILGYLKIKLKNYLQERGYYYLSYGYLPFSYKELRRLFYFKEIYDQIENVPGNIVECGVAFGTSLIILGALAEQEAKGRLLYGFDTFEGFPEPSLPDRESPHAQKGKYKHATLARVKKLISDAGSPEQTTLIKGPVEETLPRYKNKIGPIALLNIDVDLYSGYKAAFENLADQVAAKGIIALDEYNDPKFPGATKAIDEFLNDKKDRYLLKKGKYYNRYYLIKLF